MSSAGLQPAPFLHSGSKLGRFFLRPSSDGEDTLTPALSLMKRVFPLPLTMHSSPERKEVPNACDRDYATLALGDLCDTPSLLTGEEGVGVKGASRQGSAHFPPPLDSGFRRKDGVIQRSP